MIGGESDRGSDWLERGLWQGVWGNTFWHNDIKKVEIHVLVRLFEVYMGGGGGGDRTVY